MKRESEWTPLGVVFVIIMLGWTAEQIIHVVRRDPPEPSGCSCHAQGSPPSDGGAR